MRVVGALGVMLGVSGVISQATQDIPPWLYVVGSLAGSGVLIRYYLARELKRMQSATARKTEVEAAQIAEDIVRNRMEWFRAELREMEAQLQRAEVAIVSKDARIAEQDLKISRLEQRATAFRAEIERLHDLVAAYRAGEDPVKRRED